MDVRVGLVLHQVGTSSGVLLFTRGLLLFNTCRVCRVCEAYHKQILQYVLNSNRKERNEFDNSSAMMREARRQFLCATPYTGHDLGGPLPSTRDFSFGTGNCRAPECCEPSSPFPNSLRAHPRRHRAPQRCRARTFGRYNSAVSVRLGWTRRFGLRSHRWPRRFSRLTRRHAL